MFTNSNSDSQQLKTVKKNITVAVDFFLKTFAKDKQNLGVSPRGGWGPPPPPSSHTHNILKAPMYLFCNFI